jgi:hypothetical protein
MRLSKTHRLKSQPKTKFSRPRRTSTLFKAQKSRTRCSSKDLTLIKILFRKLAKMQLTSLWAHKDLQGGPPDFRDSTHWESLKSTTKTMMFNRFISKRGTTGFKGTSIMNSMILASKFSAQVESQLKSWCSIKRKIILSAGFWIISALQWVTWPIGQSGRPSRPENHHFLSNSMSMKNAEIFLIKTPLFKLIFRDTPVMWTCYHLNSNRLSDSD